MFVCLHILQIHVVYIQFKGRNPKIDHFRLQVEGFDEYFNNSIQESLTNDDESDLKSVL